MKDTAEAAIVQQELDALHAVKGKAHILQEIDVKFHHMGPGPVIIVTRYASSAQPVTLSAFSQVMQCIRSNAMYLML